MIAAQDLSLLFEQRHQVFRLGVARVAAGNKNGVHVRQLAEDLTPLDKRELNRFRVRVVLVHGRIPDPGIETVFADDARHFGHHAHRRQREMGAVGIVVGARRNQLDGVCSEHGKVPDILLPHGNGPAIVGVGFGAIAELVTAQPVMRGGFDVNIGIGGDAALPHMQSAEQVADAEENATRVVACDGDNRRGRTYVKPVAFGRAAARAGDLDRRSAGGGHSGLHLPVD